MNKNYSKTIGYSSLELVDHQKLAQGINNNKKIIDAYFQSQPDDLILVAGAGLGLEAVLIHREFQLRTIGVDLNMDSGRYYMPLESAGLELERQDLMSLAFRDNTFGMTYCYHVLEHVPDPWRVLMEIHRVLKPGGVLFIGFPNKNRLISYIGTSQKASILEKIGWNISDYNDRLQGKFENNLGAHAGFTEKEFIQGASGVFETIIPVRNKYMSVKYSAFETLIGIIIKTNLAEIIFPSNYYICIKKKPANE